MNEWNYNVVKTKSSLCSKRVLERIIKEIFLYFKLTAKLLKINRIHNTKLSESICINIKNSYIYWFTSKVGCNQNSIGKFFYQSLGILRHFRQATFP